MNDDRSQRLQLFVDWVRDRVSGDEKGQAQIYLDRLFQAFNRGGSLEVGGTPEFRVRLAREDGGGVSFADYVWKPVVLIEMKKRGADLARHYQQAFDYWVRLAPGRPQFTVLCNFDEFWVYDFNEDTNEPLDKLALSELPNRYGPLAFLFPTDERPTFKVDRVKVTREAADRLAECFRKLAQRKAVGRETAQRFILQLLIALFSEDIGLLPKYFVAQLIRDCDPPSNSYDLFKGLFDAMASKNAARGGRFKDVPYFNGGIFSNPAPVELLEDELAQLKRAVEYDWSQVSPDIFGTLFQHSMDADERHALGGHYTAPVDIMKIVKPTIVDPWQSLIENASTLAELHKLRERIGRFTVLDSACGSGNFLYIAYRELKRLEARLVERIQQKSPRDAGQRFIGHVTSKQFFGLDIAPFAVELAKVTMTLAHKLAIDELHIDEPALPLDNLDANIRCVDALISVASGAPAGRSETGSSFLPTPWPPCDVIIGNPPFLGAKRLKPERGPDYVNAVRETYPDVPGMADYCVYWLRRAHDHLKQCTPEDPVAGRAGLVGTQNIRNNQSRVGGLDYIAKSGVIVEAVDNQPWSGEANVHVSIANWVKTTNKSLLPKLRRLWSVAPNQHITTQRRARGKGPAGKQYELSVSENPHINSSLSCGTDASTKRTLQCNKTPKRCFQGKIPGDDGFMVTESELPVLGGVSEVVVPYLTGRELLDEFEITRWAVDFRNRTIIDAQKFTRPFNHVKNKVLSSLTTRLNEAKRENDNAQVALTEHLERWWQFWNRRDALNVALSSLKRYLACSRTSRRPVLVFLSTEICPSDLVQVFAFDDDYSYGILQSGAHFRWYRTSSRLKVETDLRYSVRDVFDTFPWPQAPTKKQIDSVAAAGREIRRIRAETLPNIKGGLRALYRTLELPGQNPLKDAHAALDSVALAAYDFDPKADLLKQLLDLNLSVAARIDKGDPVTAPGIPPSYPDAKSLVTEDCIQP